MKVIDASRCIHIPKDFPYACEIGKYCYAVESPKLYFYEGPECKLVIGSFVSFGPNVTIFVGGEHKKEWWSTYPFPSIFDVPKYDECISTKGDVIIGSDVWIGGNATILSGVTIGHGSIIGACSVVTKDVEPYTIVAGSPIREIRKRFSTECINKLLELQWWNHSDEEIEKMIPLLMSANERIFEEKNNGRCTMHK